ncbi:MAG TPA: MliC family protein [Croceibacterium sp.]|nr:MliC family protein [Croceibacterium sp.]
MPSRIRILAAFVPAMALAACGQSQQGNQEEGVVADVATGAPSQAATEITGPISYDCLPAQRLTATYDNSVEPSKATLVLDGKTYELTVGISASGARYVTEQGRTSGKTLVWWTKGQDGTLYEGTAGNPDAAETKIAECSPSASTAAPAAS